MVTVGIAGASGYAGEELLKALVHHPDVRVTCVAAQITRPTPIADVFPHLKGKLDLICDDYDAATMAKLCSVVFLALPHTVSVKFVPFLLAAGVKVIDLSADYRLKDPALYKKWYEVDHADIQNLKNAVYGLPELYRAEVKKTNLIANPGCYPTAAILGTAPLFKNGFPVGTVTIDAKSGYSGAGRTMDQAFLEKNIFNNFKAYKITGHRHTPEIAEQMSFLAHRPIPVTFVPHLLPIERGILETIYVTLPGRASSGKSIHSFYKEFYGSEPFVRVLDVGVFPQLKDIQNTNVCQIGIHEERESAIIVVTIDNLLKGASGQAIQNMNIMFGFKETEGLVQ